MNSSTPRTCYPDALSKRHTVLLNAKDNAELMQQHLINDFILRQFDQADATVLAEVYLKKYRLSVDARNTPTLPAPMDFLDSPACLTEKMGPSFTAEDATTFGLYPIVADCCELERLLPLGLGMIQIRAKHLSSADQDALVSDAIRLSRSYPTRLYINDAWEAAIRYGAHGVHLGQDDLDQADMDTIRTRGLRLGISTHSVAELVRAIRFHPSYVAVGTVFHTRTKVMDYAPLELEGLTFLARLSPIPVVAIGGITLEHASDVYTAGASGIAVISEIRDDPNPNERIRQFHLIRKSVIKR